MGAININSVGKIYPNGTRALEDVNIEINDGEFVVLVGPSGCGKTTLLRMVAGLEDITEGEISIDVSLLEQLGSDTYIHFFKDIKPVQTEAIEEILADEGENISVLGTQKNSLQELIQMRL